VREAYQLIKDLEPAVPQEYILKGVVNAAMGQENGSVCPLRNYLFYLQFLNFTTVRLNYFTQYNIAGSCEHCIESSGSMKD
jgi:intraflagellar transport protein 56